MKTNDLNDDINTASLLSTVYNQILNWDFEALSGEAFYNKTRSKAYIKINIYKTPNDDFPRSKVIWNADDALIIKHYPSFRAEVENELNFILKHISAVQGKPIRLTFEINDAIYDFTCFSHNPFEKATRLAIIDCFSNEDKPESRQNTVATLKSNLKMHDKQMGNIKSVNNIEKDNLF